jgi:chemotaxis protein methyltransferase CheR
MRAHDDMAVLRTAPEPKPSSAEAPTLEVARLSARSFAQFSEFITRELGIKMPPEKTTMLQSRLQRRLRQVGLRTLDDYKDHLFKLPREHVEWTEFINVVTTNKTDFFREAVHFEYLIRHALPALGDASCDLWCAGCSSGEEPYTLAMVLSDYGGSRPDFDFTLFASDISTRALDHAARAIYDEARVGPVPVGFRQRFLLRSKERHPPLVRIVPELRAKVQFARINLMDTEYATRRRFNVVFFRNVMIYFSRETQQRVLSRICERLLPGGYLFTGHAESLLGFNLPLEQMTTAVFRRMP